MGLVRPISKAYEWVRTSPCWLCEDGQVAVRDVAKLRFLQKGILAAVCH